MVNSGVSGGSAGYRVSEHANLNALLVQADKAVLSSSRPCFEETRWESFEATYSSVVRRDLHQVVPSIRINHNASYINSQAENISTDAV
jgi:hypothetical protein